MERRNFLKNMSYVTAGSIGLSAISQLASGCKSMPDKKWNVVFVLADDQGWNQVSMQGTKFYETPNIAKLATQGIYFNNAYSANPVCSPTRSSIMTGKNPARLHITDYIPVSIRSIIAPMIGLLISRSAPSFFSYFETRSGFSISGR